MLGSSRTRAQTHVPYIGRQILNHCATREVPTIYFKIIFLMVTIGIIYILIHYYLLQINTNLISVKYRNFVLI